VAESNEIAEFLLDLPEIDLLHRDDDGNDPLHLIAEHGQFPLFVKLLEKGGRKLDLNGQNVAKASPMHLMGRHGHVEMLELLLKQPGVDRNLHDLQGQTALHTAARFEQLDACRILLSLEGIEVNARDVDGVFL
jgi:ankyrin repeat protein